MNVIDLSHRYIDKLVICVCVHAHILYCGFNQRLHHKVFPLCCDLSRSEISKDDLTGSRNVLHHAAPPLCFCQTLSPFFYPVQNEYPLPFHLNTLTLRCKTLSASGQSADYMLSRGNLLTGKPEHFNHL